MATHLTNMQIAALVQLGSDNFLEFQPTDGIKKATLTSLKKGGWVEVNEDGMAKLTWQVLVATDNGWRLPAFINSLRGQRSVATQ